MSLHCRRSYGARSKVYTKPLQLPTSSPVPDRALGADCDPLLQLTSSARASNFSFISLGRAVSVDSFLNIFRSAQASNLSLGSSGSARTSELSFRSDGLLRRMPYGARSKVYTKPLQLPTSSPVPDRALGADSDPLSQLTRRTRSVNSSLKKFRSAHASNFSFISLGRAVSVDSFLNIFRSAQASNLSLGSSGSAHTSELSFRSDEFIEALPSQTLGVQKPIVEEGKTSQETKEPLMSHEMMSVDKVNCNLCGKDQDQDMVVAISPVSGMYRLDLKYPGLYRCLKTGIKFLVKGPVIIEYKVDSWNNHVKSFASHTYNILGPLFDIKILGEPNAVSAVYLPHFLCLKGFSGDTSLIKCAHFKDGNMTMETPAQIDPFYITIENPTFSCLGPLLFGKRKIPIHGIVLLYFKILCKGDPDEEYRIHLYVLPYITNVEETLDKENKKFGFQRIKKPEQTFDTVYTKIKYLVTGKPTLSACPKTVKFQTDPYHYTEIELQEKQLDVYVYLSEESTGDPVWIAHLTQRDVANVTQLPSQLTLQVDCSEGACGPSQDPSDHFLDLHRVEMICMINMVSPVLDDLLSQELLTREQYKTARGKFTSQEQMRELYDYITYWGISDKDKVLLSLKRHNPKSKIWK